MVQTDPASARPAMQGALAGTGSLDALTTLVYRSRAVRPFSGEQLLDLTAAAQQRNRSESITGVVLYDDSRFFQWLEGPADNLSRVVHSINNDRRHTDIEVLTRQPTDRRTFSGWDMKLAVPHDVPAPWTREVIRPPLGTFETLRHHPEIAASTIEQLARGRNVRTDLSTLLTHVLQADVIPQLVARHRLPGPVPGSTSVEERASHLADIVLTGDADRTLAFVRHETGLPRFDLITAAARRLGDKWMQDDCTELDVTFGLCTLQTALRQLERDAAPVVPGVGSALVAPHPGESHGLGAAISAHALRRTGWNVRCAFPDSDEALADLLARDPIDLLDLSLSPAFRREHRLDSVQRTVLLARHASLNPAMRIAVGGRIFTEESGRVAQVGADVPSAERPAPPRRATFGRSAVTRALA